MKMTEFEKAKEFKMRVNKVKEKVIEALDPEEESDPGVIASALNSLLSNFIVQIHIGEHQEID